MEVLGCEPEPWAGWEQRALAIAVPCHGDVKLVSPRGIQPMFDETAQKVVEVIASTQKLEPGKVTVDSTFEELQIDSLDGLNIVFALENEFDIDIPDEQAKQFTTVRQAAERIHALLEGRSAGENAPAPSV